jgi:hypothetical protein
MSGPNKLLALVILVNAIWLVMTWDRPNDFTDNANDDYYFSGE